MKHTVTLVFLLLCVCHYSLGICRVRNPKKVMCTYNIGEAASSNFSITANIDPTICDIIVYETIVYTPSSLYNGLNILPNSTTERNILALASYKQANPNLKVVATLQVIGYSSLLDNDFDIFINNSVNDLKSRQLDGLVLNIGGIILSTNEAAILLTVVQRLSEAYTRNALYLGLRNQGIQSYVDNINWTDMSPHIDFLILNTDFVYARSSSSKMELISGLYPRSNQTGNDLLYNVDSFINYLVGLNATKEKIILSFNLRTYRYTPANTSFTNPGDNCTTFSTSYFVGYTSYCGTFNPSAGWTVRTSAEQRVSYAYNTNNNLWLTYDDSASMLTKAEYIKNKDLYGFNFAFYTDDYSNQCGAGSYPIIRAARTGLNFNNY